MFFKLAKSPRIREKCMKSIYSLLKNFSEKNWIYGICVKNIVWVFDLLILPELIEFVNMFVKCFNYLHEYFPYCKMNWPTSGSAKIQKFNIASMYHKLNGLFHWKMGGAKSSMRLRNILDPSRKIFSCWKSSYLIIGRKSLQNAKLTSI